MDDPSGKYKTSYCSDSSCFPYHRQRQLIFILIYFFNQYNNYALSAGNFKIDKCDQQWEREERKQQQFDLNLEGMFYSYP